MSNVEAAIVGLVIGVVCSAIGTWVVGRFFNKA
jgi:hypothetical protein